MKILKYIFLLLLLTLFASTIFVATQKGDFDITRSQIIKSNRSTVFNYVNDFRNWETFGSWKKENPEMIFYYPNNTVGLGANYSWKGKDGDGEMKTVSLKNNENLHQKMDWSGSLSDVYWTFKDTVGGTKVTWRSKGRMSFGFKIYSAFKGGPNKVIGDMYEKSLANLDKTIDYEINTYAINVVGVVKKLGCYYLRQSITCRISDVPKNLRIMIPKIINFFKKNKLVMYGKPFVLYHKFDVATGITKLSVCIPIKDIVYTSEGSDITSGQLYPFKAIKTILKGDYSHSKEAWQKTSEYISKNNLSQNIGVASLELYSKNNDQIANPSQWITEIYVPIQSKSVVVYKPKAVEEPIATKSEPSIETTEP